MTNESKARWHAAKVVLAYLSIIAVIVIIGYIDLIYLFVIIASVFVLTIAGSIYNDAYYSKLVELEVKKNDQSRTN